MEGVHEQGPSYVLSSTFSLGPIGLQTVCFVSFHKSTSYSSTPRFSQLKISVREKLSYQYFLQQALLTRSAEIRMVRGWKMDTAYLQQVDCSLMLFITLNLSLKTRHISQETCCLSLLFTLKTKVPKLHQCHRRPTFGSLQNLSMNGS